MRSSVEGLNQEIEKLVLVPGQQHSCRPESNHFARGIPEGHRAPLADILHSDTRSVNTQTPNRDLQSSGMFFSLHAYSFLCVRSQLKIKTHKFYCLFYSNRFR